MTDFNLVPRAFPPKRAQKAQASKGVLGHALTENFLDFNSLKSPFLGLFWVIQTGYWPDSNLGRFLMEMYLFMKNLTDFRKTVKTGVDPHLLTIRIENDR